MVFWERLHGLDDAPYFLDVQSMSHDFSRLSAMHKAGTINRLKQYSNTKTFVLCLSVCSVCAHAFMHA